ncbi:MAG: DUF3727 domain-containing protein [Cyanobacteria bacterium J06639_1]
MSNTLQLRDDRQQTLVCEILEEIALDGKNYALIMPACPTIQLLNWEDDEGVERDEAPADVDGSLTEPEPEEVEAALPVARAMLEELNLKLQLSAYTMTVEGNLPEPQEDNIVEIVSDEGDVEEFQLLATFFNQDRQYGLFAPLDPLLFFAVVPDGADPYLLPPDAPDELLDRLQDRLLDLAQ